MGDELLVATGRAPVTDGLGLDKAGAANVRAAGDVAGSPQFTHASWHGFRVLRADMTGGEASARPCSGRRRARSPPPSRWRCSAASTAGAVVTRPSRAEGLDLLFDALG